jgi:hypothetical protein
LETIAGIVPRKSVRTRESTAQLLTSDFDAVSHAEFRGVPYRSAAEQYLTNHCSLPEEIHYAAGLIYQETAIMWNPLLRDERLVHRRR